MQHTVVVVDWGRRKEGRGGKGGRGRVHDNRYKVNLKHNRQTHTYGIRNSIRDKTCFEMVELLYLTIRITVIGGGDT